MLQSDAPLTAEADDTPAQAIPFTVIIPAHNEAAVIARSLRAILDTAPSHAKFEVIVVANGCDDRTADIAREFGETVRIIEFSKPSKSQAINLGWRAKRHSIILVVDADILTSYHALATTALALTKPHIMAASPKLSVDTSRASAWVRAYYRIWLSLPYVTDNLIGGGVYGLSQDAQRVVGALPNIIADDLFVRTRFRSDQRLTVSHDFAGREVGTVMLPPANVFDLIRIEARRLRGKIEIERHHETQEARNINGLVALRASWHSGTTATDMAAYIAVKVAGRVLHTWNLVAGSPDWARDETTRSG